MTPVKLSSTYIMRTWRCKLSTVIYVYLWCWQYQRIPECFRYVDIVWMVSWDLVPCDLAGRYRRFGRSCCLGLICGSLKDTVSSWHYTGWRKGDLTSKNRNAVSSGFCSALYSVEFCDGGLMVNWKRCEGKRCWPSCGVASVFVYSDWVKSLKYHGSLYPSGESN
jgi:hypothetical protein